MRFIFNKLLIIIYYSLLFITHYYLLLIIIYYSLLFITHYYLLFITQPTCILLAI